MPTEIEGLREGQLDRLRVTTKIRPGHTLGNLYTSTAVGPGREAPGVEGLGAVEPMDARAYKDGRFSWIDVNPKGGIPMRITHTLGANLRKPPCKCARTGLGDLSHCGPGCGCPFCRRFVGLGDLAAAADEQPVVELTVQFMGDSVTPAAVRSEVQRLAAMCGCRLAAKRKAQVEQYVLWTWKTIGGDRWRAYIANSGPFQGTPGPVVSLARSGQPPTVRQTNLLPGQIQRFTFRLIPEDGQDKQQSVKDNLTALQIMLERSGAAQISARLRTLSLPTKTVEALEGLEGFNPGASLVDVGLIAIPVGLGYLAYRLYKQAAR